MPSLRQRIKISSLAEAFPTNLKTAYLGRFLFTILLCIALDKQANQSYFLKFDFNFIVHFVIVTKKAKLFHK